MTTITNTTGSEAVKVSKNVNRFIAMYVQIYNGTEQVLQSKFFATEKRALTWANLQLN